MPRLSLLLPTLVGALALGCADSQSPTSVAVGPTGPAFSVDRSTEPFGFAFADDRFVIVLGLGLEGVITAVCDQQFIDVERLQALTVTRPDGSQKALQQGTLSLVVVDLAGPDFCADPTVTFVGTGRVLYTDNDVFVTGNRANASQIQVNGKVTDASGQAYHLTAINVTVRAPGDDPDDILNQNTQIKLSPIGD